MIYLFFIVSVTLNILLAWYIRKVLGRYWFDALARERFIIMLGQYESSLNSLYQLEELYGEEIIKRAINQTQFVIEACKEFREAISNEAQNQETTQQTYEAAEEDIEPTVVKKDESVIRLREGESVSQKASDYKKVIRER